MKQLYSDAEQLIIDHWLGIAPIEDKAILDDLLWGLGVDWLCRSDIQPEAVLVARWLLKDINHSLPNWNVSQPDGGIIFARGPVWVEKLSHSVSVIPTHLLTINWADSAPGVSWPESYHACPLPGYDKIVVTASVDCTEAYGYAYLGH